MIPLFAYVVHPTPCGVGWTEGRSERLFVAVQQGLLAVAGVVLVAVEEGVEPVLAVRDLTEQSAEQIELAGEFATSANAHPVEQVLFHEPRAGATHAVLDRAMPVLCCASEAAHDVGTDGLHPLRHRILGSALVARLDDAGDDVEVVLVATHVQLAHGGDPVRPGHALSCLVLQRCTHEDSDLLAGEGVVRLGPAGEQDVLGLVVGDRIGVEGRHDGVGIGNGDHVDSPDVVEWVSPLSVSMYRNGGSTGKILGTQC